MPLEWFRPTGSLRKLIDEFFRLRPDLGREYHNSVKESELGNLEVTMTPPDRKF
jgi:hypothetical protein